VPLKQSKQRHVISPTEPCTLGRCSMFQIK